MKPVLDFIDGATARKKPFLVWYAPFLPHTPHNPPSDLLEKYREPGRPENVAKYYAMCEWFDRTCGELLDHLDRRGLREQHHRSLRVRQRLGGQEEGGQSGRLVAGLRAAVQGFSFRNGHSHSHPDFLAGPP